VHVLETERESAQALGGTPKPGVKYDFSGPTPIVLVPQPSDDPNDPLVRPFFRLRRNYHGLNRVLMLFTFDDLFDRTGRCGRKMLLSLSSR
jgi:hypothetical protein